MPRLINNTDQTIIMTSAVKLEPRGTKDLSRTQFTELKLQCANFHPRVVSGDIEVSYDLDFNVAAVEIQPVAVDDMNRDQLIDAIVEAGPYEVSDLEGVEIEDTETEDGLKTLLLNLTA